MKKILVVGGSGYVGGNIVNLLLKKKNKFKVTVLDSLLYEEQYFKNCNFVNCDIRDKQKLKSIISKYDVVIWLAAIVGDGACNINPLVTAEVNLDSIKFIGYAFQIEMKYRAFAKNFNIQEVPVIFTDRTKGQSKMSGSIIKEAIFGVISLRFRKFLNRL